jgi:hypothetical protein
LATVEREEGLITPEGHREAESRRHDDNGEREDIEPQRRLQSMCSDWRSGLDCCGVAQDVISRSSPQPLCAALRD